MAPARFRSEATMDVPASKPVSGVSSAAQQATGRHPVIAAEPPSEPAAPAAEPLVAPAPVEGLLHTQQVIAEQVSRYLQSTTRNLEFQVDGESGTAVIVVRDAEGQVIRRIPGEEVLQIARRLNAQSGTLINSTA